MHAILAEAAFDINILGDRRPQEKQVQLFPVVFAIIGSSH